jgi:subtilase family serine protease
VHRVTPAEPGELRFHCRLDTGQAIAETDESNNELELKLTVTSLRRASPATPRFEGGPR